MKKVLVVLLTFVVLATALIACSKTDKGSKKDTTTTRPPGILTEDAKIKGNEAIDFIRSQYSLKELGLDKIDKDLHFMIGSEGEEIQGKKYVKVVANVPVQNEEPAPNGQPTYTMETYGEYYISFDGQTVLRRDIDKNEYIELENKYPNYSQKGDQNN